jgi:hypothetical protein
MSTFIERFRALMTRVELPRTRVDLGTWRRLEAMRDRIADEDHELARDPDAMAHVVYAAIMGGLAESEREAGVSYDENTGLPVERACSPTPAHPRSCVGAMETLYWELEAGTRDSALSAFRRLHPDWVAELERRRRDVGK